MGKLKHVFLALSIGLLLVAPSLVAPPLAAQETRVGDAWQQVYDRLPDLPRENQYVNRDTGKVTESNTLISRLIRYHVYVKSRPVNFRLDWKLTLADYLGANELIISATYPGGDALRTNPLPGDVAAIQGLNRAQRDALVQTLVDVFSVKTEETPAAAPVTPVPSPVPAEPVREPRPGDAQLLLP
jgi:hypothetical protein